MSKTPDSSLILPNTKSVSYHFEGKRVFYDSSKAYAGIWRLPGYREYNTRETCGKIRSVQGCLDTHRHLQLGEKEGTQYVKIKKNYCYKFDCPECYQAWATRQSERIVNRLKQIKIRGMEAYKIVRKDFQVVKSYWVHEPIHVIVSLPKQEWGKTQQNRGKLKGLKQKVYKMLEEVGFLGGCIVYHPFRYDDFYMGYYESPHFHVLGFGWIYGKKVKENEDRTGYVIKNLGKRDSVFHTALYELGHAGVHKGRHTVTWFGICAYTHKNAKDIQPIFHDKDKCPICENYLKMVEPLKPGEFEAENYEKGKKINQLIEAFAYVF